MAIDGRMSPGLFVLREGFVSFQEFHLRRIHGMLTDFIYQMPLKVRNQTQENFYSLPVSRMKRIKIFLIFRPVVMFYPPIQVYIHKLHFEVLYTSALNLLLGQLGIYATWLSSIAYLQKQLHIFIFFYGTFFSVITRILFA